MKEKIKKYWWVIIIVVVISSAFYWYEWRPSQIRKECVQQILESAKGKNLSAYELQTGLDFCLTRHGLEK